MKKEKAETWVYAFATALTIIGAGLCLTGILVPQWYEVSRFQGIAEIKAEIGIWQDRICVGGRGCNNHWVNDDDYDRNPDFEMPKKYLIRWFETVGTGLGFLTILLLIPLWGTHLMGSSKCIKRSAFTYFFSIVMIAGFFCEVGVLILASEVETSDSGFAPFLCGVGGALFFIAGCSSCAVCRYDPSYGTLENPVSPTYVQA